MDVFAILSSAKNAKVHAEWTDGGGLACGSHLPGAGRYGLYEAEMFITNPYACPRCVTVVEGMLL